MAMVAFAWLVVACGLSGADDRPDPSSARHAESHWSLVAPRPTPVPTVASTTPPADPIDAFLAPDWVVHDLSPQTAAERPVWLRRASLALIGLPPSPEELRRFLGDRHPAATQRAIDRLLADPRHGEHTARSWLDLIRYADTHGLNFDNYREVWPYRDWLVQACNQGLSFDRFATAQLAGDLLDNPSIADLVATGFLRMHLSTNETGSIVEEVRFRYETDRTESFGTAFLGLTLNCAACHDHKYDPLTMADFYSLSAFFNGLDGPVLDSNAPAPEPALAVPTVEQQRQQATSQIALRQLEADRRAPHAALDQRQRDWESYELGQSSAEPPRWRGLRSSGEVGGEAVAQALARIRPRPLQAIFELPPEVDWQQLQVTLQRPPATAGEGPSATNAVEINEIELLLQPAPDEPWLSVRTSFAEGVAGPASGSESGKLIDLRSDPTSGIMVSLAPGEAASWQLACEGLRANGTGGRLRVLIHARTPDRTSQTDIPFSLRADVATQWLVPPPDDRLQCGPWYRLGPLPIENAFAGYQREVDAEREPFDPQRVFHHEGAEYKWQLLTSDISGELTVLPDLGQEPSVTLLYRTIDAMVAQPLSLLIGSQDGIQIYLNGSPIGATEGPKPHHWCSQTFRGHLHRGRNELLIKQIGHGGPASLSVCLQSPTAPLPPRIAEIVARDAATRSPDDAALLRRFYRRAVCNAPEALDLQARERAILANLSALEQSIAHTPIWRELPAPRPAFLHERGQYDQPTEPMERQVPAVLPPLTTATTPTRLDLARWLFADHHPLTARVVVNRYWQQLFGAGLVRTPEDFGLQGERPTHPQLLDWLSIDLQRQGWDTKRLQRELALSAAFARRSSASESDWQRDPSNRWLARGPRYRLDAEIIRDQAFAIGGLLSNRLGGPSVRPPQPSGLWEAVAQGGSNTETYTADEGEAIYRRSVYTFWKRTAPPAVLAIGDAPNREACIARRERTNTALQALAVLNDPQQAIAAFGLANRAYASGQTDADRLRAAWTMAVCRPPDPDELAELESLLQTARAAASRDVAELPADRPLDRADEPFSEQAQAIVPECIPPADRQAWWLVAQLILNLDELLNL
jgi:hypothetical protein